MTAWSRIISYVHRGSNNLKLVVHITTDRVRLVVVQIIVPTVHCRLIFLYAVRFRHAGRCSTAAAGHNIIGNPTQIAQSLACSIGWFVSLLVREEVLLASLCKRKILFWLKIYDRI